MKIYILLMPIYIPPNLPPSSPLSTYGPIPLLVLAATMNMYFLPVIRLLITTFVSFTSLLISSAESSVGLYLTSFPIIIPFLSFSSGGSQDRVTEVLVLIISKFSGGPLGATEKERIVYKCSHLRKRY